LISVPYIVYKLYPPEIKQINNREISQQGLKQLGTATRREKTLVMLFVLAVLGWATGGITNIDATAVAIGFIGACLITGVVKWDNILNARGAWSTLIWYGGIISLADGLANARFFDWLAQLLGQNISFVGYNTFVIYTGLLLLGLSVRYFFASLAPYFATFIPVLFTLGVIAQIPPYALVFLLSAEAEFGCLLTHYGHAVAPVLFGAGYVDQTTWWKIGTIITLFCAIVYMTVGMAYWKMLGLW